MPAIDDPPPFRSTKERPSTGVRSAYERSRYPLERDGPVGLEASTTGRGSAVLGAFATGLHTRGSVSDDSGRGFQLVDANEFEDEEIRGRLPRGRHSHRT